MQAREDPPFDGHGGPVRLFYNWVMSDSAPIDAKIALRNAALLQRDRAAEEAGPKAPLTIARRVLGDFVFMKGAVIAGYAAIRGEIDPFPLMAALANQGHALCLPQTKGKAMFFRAW